jgi:hypothetical protein
LDQWGLAYTVFAENEDLNFWRVWFHWDLSGRLSFVSVAIGFWVCMIGEGIHHIHSFLMKTHAGFSKRLLSSIERFLVFCFSGVGISFSNKVALACPIVRWFRRCFWEMRAKIRGFIDRRMGISIEGFLSQKNWCFLNPHKIRNPEL